MASRLAFRHTYHHAMSLSNCYGQLGTSMVGPKPWGWQLVMLRMCSCGRGFM
jgi:hypothetical protein